MIRLPIFLLAAALLAQEQPAGIKVLTIGNSFAGNATQYLAAIGEAQGIPITVLRTNLGGASLARHAGHLQFAKSDPQRVEGRPYAWPEAAARISLLDALRSGRWDFITIQQFSGDSYKPETFEPHASEIMEAVRQYAGRARVLVHQTWAFREDHPDFATGALNQQQMFERLRNAYSQLAERYGLGIIPVGEAFQNARAMPQWRFAFPDPAFDYRNPAPGSLPNQPGSLMVGWFWQTDAKSGAKQLKLDAKHANAAGKYLGACVFFEVLTGKSATAIAWRPPELTEEQAASLRAAAHQAAVNRKTPKALGPPVMEEAHAEQKRRVDAAVPAKAPAKPKKPRRILVSSLTIRDGKPWRSSSYLALPAMRYAIAELGRRTGAYEAVFSNDPEMLRPEKLRGFDAICFANTNGVLFEDAALRQSLLDFIAKGKGLIGIHDAIATFVQYPKYDQWPAFGQLLGGTENGGHPWNGELMTLKVEDRRNHLTAMFPEGEFRITDQAFQLQEPEFRSRLRVLLSIDLAKTPLPAGRRILPVRSKDMDFPVSWVHPYKKGRVFYLGLGHSSDVFWNAKVLEHLLAGIQYATGDLKVKDKPTAIH
jgi:type 1 glutamine amidotransferase